MRAPRLVGFRRRRVVLPALLLPVAFALTTTACTHRPEEPYYPACPGLTSAPAAAQTYDRQAEPYETATYTFVVVGNAGMWQDDPAFSRGEDPRWKATVSVGPWVRGSDQVGLDSAWRAVSKTDAMPLPSGPYGKTWAVAEVGYDISLDTRYVCLDSQKAAYLFGTVTFEDVTEFSKPFPEGYQRPAYPTSHEIQDVSLELVPGPGGAGIPELFGCHEQRCGQSEKGRESEELLLPIIYGYSDENQEGGPGPHPFVIAVPDAFASPSGADQMLVLDSVLHLVKGTFPIEQDGDQGLGTDIPTRLGW